MKALKMFVLSIFILTGCGPVLQSLPIRERESQPNQCPGAKQCDHLLIYALPQTYIELVGTPKKTSSTGVENNQNKNEGKPNPLNTTATASVGNITVNTQSQSRSNSSGSLPKISFQNSDGEVFYEITVREHVYADEPERFSLIRQGNNFSKDTINVSVNNRGLLNNAAITSDGRIDETLVALARSAGSVLGALSGGALPSGVESFIAETKPDINPFRLICKVEGKTLVNAYETDNNNETDKSCSTGMWSFSLLPAAQESDVAECDQDKLDSCNSIDSSDGIYYRIRRLGILSAKYNFASEPLQALSPLVYIDSDSLFSVQPRRNGFGENNQTLTFENGVLLSHNAVFESTAEQIVSLPADIIGGLLSAVSNIFTLRINNINNESALIEAQKELEAAIAELQAQRESSQQQ